MDFQEFYKSTYKVVYLYFYYRVDEKSVIDDLAQDVYYEFYKKYRNGSYASPDKVKVLMGYCKIKYKEYIRKAINKNHISYDILDNYNYEQFSDSNNQSNYESKKIKLILNSIKKLRNRVRAVIEYRFIYNLSREETAKVLGMKERDVLKYQQRGIKYIKKLVSGENQITRDSTKRIS